MSQDKSQDSLDKSQESQVSIKVKAPLTKEQKVIRNLKKRERAKRKAAETCASKDSQDESHESQDLSQGFPDKSQETQVSQKEKAPLTKRQKKRERVKRKLAEAKVCFLLHVWVFDY